ncbi:MAG: hypothetical protein ACPHL8_05305, partial [Flavobacteriales bacterium]
PKIPRIIKTFLLLPNKGMPNFWSIATLNTIEMMERNKMSSWAGIWGKYFTQICMRAKASVEPSI